MNSFISGAIMMAWASCGLFFFRFWKATRERFFAFFGLAFSMLAIERLVLAFFVSLDSEFRPYVYLIRALAFVLIIIAVFEKNRTS
jgi:hypothetical protein